MVIRFCAAFVDYLGTLLKAAMLIAAAMFVTELQLLLNEIEDTDSGNLATGIENPEPTEPERNTEGHAPVLSEAVLYALNCTYIEYRRAHFDDCVREPSQMYPQPAETPSDENPEGAWIQSDSSRVLLAGLE